MFGNVKEFPKPLGQYVVGITEMDFVDQERKGVFNFCKDEVRKIPTRIFYPADSREGKNSSPYLHDEERMAIAKASHGFLSQKSLTMRTHCFSDVSISTQKEKFPVIFYNHGYFSYPAESTVLCSNLASKGYIVVAIGHPYEAGALKYQDGTVIRAKDELFKEFRNAMNKEVSKKLESMSKGECSDEKIGVIAEEIHENFKNTKVWTDVNIWAQDTRFVADQLCEVNEGSIPSMFKDRLDLNLGFGITGHSYGGCTAAQVCLEDERFQCGVNMDAPSYGEYYNKDIEKPYMFVGSDYVENMSKNVYLNNSKDSYFIVIKGSKHMDFTDHLYFARHMKLVKLIGKRDRELIEEIVYGSQVDFFHKYLLKDEKAMIQEYSYPGVKISYKKQRLSAEKTN